MTLGKLVSVALVLLLPALPPNASVFPWETNQIAGYHYHTYFFEKNENYTKAALRFRDAIQDEIKSGTLKGCRLGFFWMGGSGPHPIGSFETCCNASSLSQSQSWFLQNHGELSVLLHPLTRWEVKDHTERAVWLGQPVPLDKDWLKDDLGERFWDVPWHDLCQPQPNAHIGVRHAKIQLKDKIVDVSEVDIWQRKPY